MARKISISCKETSKDIELYNYIMRLDDKSAEIKSILRNHFKNNIIEKKEVKKDTINVTDF